MRDRLEPVCRRRRLDPLALCHRLGSGFTRSIDGACWRTVAGGGRHTRVQKLPEIRISTLLLNRLDAGEGTVLAETVAGKALPDEVVTHIAARADGVPLFVEELTRAVLESGLVRDEGDRYALDRPLPSFAIPPSLHASLLARLDHLGRTAKEIA